MTYGAVGIVKDEAGRIGACLDSLRPHLSSWTFLDTGSTDGTPELIERSLEGIPGALHRTTFVNFGQARSEAFALARGTADWLIATDADMTWEIDPDWQPDPAVDCYMVEMRDSGLSWRLPLVLRGDLPWESRGVVHEYTALPDRAYISQPTDAILVSFPPTQSSPSKRHWHAGLLEEELARNPFDARSTFYLAQSYRELGDPRARDLYVKRSVMDASEEAWYAAYRASLLTDWPAQAAELMAAWERWPARLEPLYWAAKGLNEHGCHRAAYQLTDICLGCPESSYVGGGGLATHRPECPLSRPPDALFVEPGVWAWGIAFERSVAAWYAGHRDESRALSLELLKNERLPVSVREAVTRNLALTPSEAEA